MSDEEFTFVRFVWFGFIRCTKNGEICIVDELSLKETRFKFKLPPAKTEERIRLLDASSTDQFVFILSEGASSNLKHLFAWELRTECLFQINDPEWISVDGLCKSCAPLNDGLLTDQFASSRASRSRVDQFKYKNDPAPEKSVRQCQQLLACTAFGAFLLTNAENGAVLGRIHDSRFNQQSCAASTSSARHEYRLTFKVQRLSAGRDHLAMLDAKKGEVWTLGTGTRGELGTGHVEAGNWTDGPRKIHKVVSICSLVSHLVEAGIRCVDVQCGAWHTVALTDEGDVYGWGWNGNGQLGQSETDFSIQPTPFPFDIDDQRCAAIHCDGNETFLLLNNGVKRTFGEFGAFKKP